MRLSFYTTYLLAQHLYWVENGYDIVNLNKVINTIRKEKFHFGPVEIYQIVEKTGKPITNDFKLEDLEKLTYLYANLFSNVATNLSFLKYCKNLIEVDFRLAKLVDIKDFVHLKNVVQVNLDFNQIKSIEALTTLTEIEELRFYNSNTVSLTPLINHKKIKKISLNLVENEEDILNIISNQEVVSAQYLIENKTTFLGLSFPRFLIDIALEKDMLYIEMASKLHNKYGDSISHEIPTEFIEDEDFIEAYIKLYNAELDKRVKSILKTNYEIVESSDSYTYDEVKFDIEVKIKKL